jgi:hypothetical protein
MTKKIVNKPKEASKELVKPLTKEEVKETLPILSSYDAHPKEIYKKI